MADGMDAPSKRRGRPPSERPLRQFMLRLDPAVVDALVRAAAAESSEGGTRTLSAQDVARRAIEAYLRGSAAGPKGGGAGTAAHSADSPVEPALGSRGDATADSTPDQPLRGGPVTKPLLYWPGGKWRLGKWIASWFPAHDVYVEPFGGAASVLLQKEPCRSEVYNDLDWEVVGLIRVLLSDAMLDDLSWGLRLTKYAPEEFEDAYHGGRFPNAVEASRRLVVRSLMGEGNSGAMGPKKAGFRAMTDATWAHWCKYPNRLPEIAARLRGVEIENGQAIPLMLRRDGPDTLFYVDPPYLQETRRDDRYYRHEMTAEQHVELLGILRELDGMVVLSGYPSALYDGLLAGWARRETTARTFGGRERVECVWLNPACARRLAARGSPVTAA